MLQGSTGPTGQTGDFSALGSLFELDATHGLVLRLDNIDGVPKKFSLRFDPGGIYSFQIGTYGSDGVRTPDDAHSALNIFFNGQPGGICRDRLDEGCLSTNRNIECSKPPGGGPYYCWRNVNRYTLG
jgi:hypothetical protein